MKLKKTLALGLVAAMAASFTACGSTAAESTADSTASGEAAAEAAADAPDGDGDPTTLTVAMECAYAPYNWTQSDDSNGAVAIRGSSDYAYGYDVMMAKKIADALGQNVQIVKLDWDSLIPAVMSGDVDCVIAGQSITAERAAQVDFSDPYYYASIITLTKKDSQYASAASVADLAGATATSQLGTIWYDNCLSQIPDANILPAQETAPSMLVALNSGACDIVVTDRPTGQAALVAYPDFTLLDFGGGDNDFQVSDEDINIGISVRKGNTVLNEVIDTLDLDMTYGKLYKMVEVTSVDSTQIMQITVTDTDAERAGEIAQTIADIVPDVLVEKVEAGSCKTVSDVSINPNKVFPQTKKYVVMAGLLGAVLVCGILVLAHLLHDTVVDDEDVQKKLGLPVLGLIPEV